MVTDMPNQPFIYMGGSQQVPKDIIHAEIHPSVKTIEPNAFSDCKELRYVKFSDGLEVIGHRAFYRCAKLTFIRLSSTTKKIEMAAFRSCKKLKHVLFNEGLEELGTSAFAECKALQFLSFSSMMQLVGQGVFLGCTGLQKVAFNLGLEKIESGAFSNCRKLKLIVMPSEVPSVASDAIPDEAIVEDTRNEKLWIKVLRTAEEVEADLVKQYGTVGSSEEIQEPENDATEPFRTSVLEAARLEIEMLKDLLKDVKIEGKKRQEDLESVTKDRDNLSKTVKIGKDQLEDAMTLAEELQEELTFVDEQKQATQELLEKALDQRDELARAKEKLALDQPNALDFKEFEEHFQFIEAQAEETRTELQKTAKDCTTLRKENAQLKKKNKQLEQILQARNKEFMDLLAQHVDTQLHIMGASPEQVKAAMKSSAISPATPTKKKKAMKAAKSPGKSPGKSPETPAKKKKAAKKKKSSPCSSKVSIQPVDDHLKNKKAVATIPPADLIPIAPLAESEFGSEPEVLDESKIDMEAEAVKVITEEVGPEDDWEESLHESLDSCCEKIDKLGHFDEVTANTESRGDALLKQ